MALPGNHTFHFVSPSTASTGPVIHCLPTCPFHPSSVLQTSVGPGLLTPSAFYTPPAPRKVVWWALRSLRVEEWAVRVIQSMYFKARGRAQVNGQYSEEFGAGVGVHQGSVLSPLLFILVLEALSHEFHTGVPWELLYIDDLVLIADTQEECISKPKAWKAGMESKGLHVNMKKTKFLVSGDDQNVLQKSGKYPCAFCCSGVARNSILCSQCMLWVHKTCRGITKWLVKYPNYISALGVRMSLGPSMAKLWLKRMSTAPCLMWKPISATLLICCAVEGAMTVPLLPDVVWPGESSGNPSLSLPPVTSHPRYVARYMWPAFTRLCFMIAKRGHQRNPSCGNDRAMIGWICGIKDRDETPSASLPQKLDMEDITSVLRCTTGHVLYQIYHNDKLSDSRH